MNALETIGLSVTFGGLRAVDRVDIAVPEGQIVGLIGPNGAGKTTFIDAVTGFVPSQGSVQLFGSDIAGLPSHRRARAGLSRTWQTIEIFDDLSVHENIAVAVKPPSWSEQARSLFTGSPATDPLIHRSLELLELAGAAEMMPTDLTQSERTRVGIARSIAMDPDLLLLDEPAAGLDASESLELGRTLRRLVEGGTAMLLVDHDVGLVLSVCDYIYVLEFGAIIAEGAPDEIRTDQRVAEAYLGAAAHDLVDDSVGGER